MKLTLLLLLLPLCAYGQSNDLRYLVVKGSAEVQVPVDYLEVSVTITTYGQSLKAANDTNRATVLRLFEVFRRFSIPDSAFQTQNNASGEDYGRREPDRHLFIRYSGLLHLTTPFVYDSLFQAMMELGGVSVSITSFGSVNHAYYRALAYQKAVDAARREAQMMLKGSKQSVGQIIKLIQDNRDIFTQYDNLESLIGQGAPPPGTAFIIAEQRSQPVSTFRKHYFSEVGQVTVSQRSGR